MTVQIWLTTAQAAERANRHANTVRRALEAGELHGRQRVKGGVWSIHRDCLDAWVGGEACPRHPAAAAADAA